MLRRPRQSRRGLQRTMQGGRAWAAAAAAGIPPSFGTDDEREEVLSRIRNTRNRAGGWKVPKST
eukprot:2934386-Rhodomonas_salina.3